MKNKIMGLIFLSYSSIVLSNTNIEESVMTPLNDLGIQSIKIDKKLIQASERKFTPILNCEEGLREIKELEPFFQIEKISQSEKLVNKLIVDTMTSWIPMRGAVRKITGSEKESDKKIEIFKNAELRLVYIKGYLDGACLKNGIMFGRDVIEME